MQRDELPGTELPSGQFTCEDWKAFLWADATRNEEDAFRYEDVATAAGEPGQLIPHTMCQHIVFEATGGIEATMSRLADDWQSGAALGQLSAEFHAPLETGQPLDVTGEITEVRETEGSSGGLTFVTHAYEVTTPEGASVFDVEADMVLLESA